MSLFVSLGFPHGQEKVYRTYYFTSRVFLKKLGNTVKNAN